LSKNFLQRNLVSGLNPVLAIQVNWGAVQTRSWSSTCSLVLLWRPWLRGCLLPKKLVWTNTLCWMFLIWALLLVPWCKPKDLRFWR